jgi:hypothetical protein
MDQLRLHREDQPISHQSWCPDLAHLGLLDVLYQLYLCHLSASACSMKLACVCERLNSPDTFLMPQLVEDVSRYFAIASATRRLLQPSWKHSTEHIPLYKLSAQPAYQTIIIGRIKRIISIYWRKSANAGTEPFKQD